MEAVRLQSNQDLRVWERLTLVVGDGADAGRYLARIEDFINNGIIISQPERISGNIGLRDNVMIVVQFTRPDAAYEFESCLMVREREKGTYCLLTPARSVRRVQRRMFCRIEISSEVLYQIIEGDWEWKLPESNRAWITGRTVDVSAGGLLMRCGEELPRGTIVLLRPEMFRHAELPSVVLGICRRAFTNEVGPFVGLEFIKSGDAPRILQRRGAKTWPDEIFRFDHRAQDRLSHLVFDIQVERRSKGLL